MLKSMQRLNGTRTYATDTGKQPEDAKTKTTALAAAHMTTLRIM